MKMQELPQDLYNFARLARLNDTVVLEIGKHVKRIRSQRSEA